jgi:CDP-paratose 2-epimerase
MTNTVLIAGGSGFIGSRLAIGLSQSSIVKHVIAFDNLSRRGSELNLPKLRHHGVDFVLFASHQAVVRRATVIAS